MQSDAKNGPRWWIVWLVAIVAGCVLFAQFVGTARAEPPMGHHSYHSHYQSWVNNAHQGCCNDQDCRPLDEKHERIRNNRLEVYIEGVGAAKGTSSWCEVTSKHYLSKGNAPNASTAHVCVTTFNGRKTPCEQFICFQPRPQT